MKVVIDFSTFDKALNTVSKAINDKTSTDEYKNAIFWFKNSVLTLVGMNSSVTTTVIVDCKEIEQNFDEQVYQIKLKELDRIVSAYKGLTRTQADDITFVFKDNRVSISIREQIISGVALDEESYNQATKFAISIMPVPQKLLRIIDTLTSYQVGEQITIPSASLSRYLNLLAPPIVRDSRDNASTRLYCTHKKLFIIPYSYMTVMDNDLDDKFDNFVLTHKVVNYLNDFINGYEEIIFSKYETENNIVLILYNGYANTYLTVLQADERLDVPKEICDMSHNNKITLDKYYFRDVLKRLSVSEDIVGLIVDLDKGEFITQTRNVKQRIPLQKYSGTGVYKWTMTIPLLVDLINNQSYLQSDIDIYLKPTEEVNSMSLTLTDATVSKNGNKLWYMGVRGLECEEVLTEVESLDTDVADVMSYFDDSETEEDVDNE